MPRSLEWLVAVLKKLIPASSRNLSNISGEVFILKGWPDSSPFRPGAWTLYTVDSRLALTMSVLL